MYDALLLSSCHLAQQTQRHGIAGATGFADILICSYKGMAQAAPASSARNITPQATGFSQVHSRGGGEGGGQAMSVLLSWHEKVRDSNMSTYTPHPQHATPEGPSSTAPHCNIHKFHTDFHLACGGSWSWQHCQGHDGPPHGLSCQLHRVAIATMSRPFELPHTNSIS